MEFPPVHIPSRNPQAGQLIQRPVLQGISHECPERRFIHFGGGSGRFLSDPAPKYPRIVLLAGCKHAQPIPEIFEISGDHGQPFFHGLPTHLKGVGNFL